MNKTICSLMMGVVLCVIAPAVMANYCTDQNFGSGNTLGACNYGDGFRSELGVPGVYYVQICTNYCNGKGQPNSDCYNTCESTLATGVLPSPCGATDMGCRYGALILSAMQASDWLYDSCAKYCKANTEVVQNGFLCTCIKACVWPTAINCKDS